MSGYVSLLVDEDEQFLATHFISLYGGTAVTKVLVKSQLGNKPDDLKNIKNLGDSSNPNCCGDNKWSAGGGGGGGGMDEESFRMLTGRFYNIFVTQVRLFSTYCAIPYQWDDKSGKLKATCVIRTWIWKCLALVHCRYALFLIVRLVQSIVDPSYGSAAKLAVFGWVALHNCSSIWYIPLFIKRVELMEVINFMIDFELRYVETGHQRRRSRNMEILLNSLLLCSSILTVVIPYLIPLIFWLHPCEPQFLGSMFLTCSKDGSYTWIFLLLKLAFLILEIIASQQMIYHTIFMLFTCFYLPVKCLGGYLDYLKTIRLNHFQFRPIFLRRLTLYRRLQLLTTVLNEVFHTTLLLFKIILSTVIMTLIYFFAKMYKPDSGFPVIGQVCIHMSLWAAISTLYAIYGTAGKIYHNSELVVTRWKRLGQINRLRWVRTSFQAMRPICIRIGFGSFSFIRPCTWLSVIYFCAKHAILFTIISEGRKK